MARPHILRTRGRNGLGRGLSLRISHQELRHRLGRWYVVTRHGRLLIGEDVHVARADRRREYHVHASQQTIELGEALTSRQPSRSGETQDPAVMSGGGF